MCHAFNRDDTFMHSQSFQNRQNVNQPFTEKSVFIPYSHDNLILNYKKMYYDDKPLVLFMKGNRYAMTRNTYNHNRHSALKTTATRIVY